MYFLPSNYFSVRSILSLHLNAGFARDLGTQGLATVCKISDISPGQDTTAIIPLIPIGHLGIFIFGDDRENQLQK